MATYKVKSRGVEYTVEVVDKATGGGSVTIDGQTFEVEFVGGVARPVPAASDPAPPVAVPVAPASGAAPSAPPAAAGSGAIIAPIPGKVIAVHVKVGDAVEANQIVLKLEAMKMENDIASPIAGTVVEVAVGEGSEASAGQLLMVVG